MHTWNAAILGWLAWLAAGAVRKQTIDLRRYQIRRLADEVGRRSPWDVTEDDLAGWLGGREWSLETLRSHRSALRSFYGWAHASGHVSADPARLLRKVAATPGKARPADEDHVHQAIAVADERTYLMLLLGARHGLRRGEISRVHTDHLVKDLGGWSLEVDGKGGKWRTVPLGAETARLIRQRPPGWVFPGGHDGHLTAAHVGRLVSRTLPEGVTTHQLRHRFATIVYQRTNNIVAVQQLLGHASVATTQRYVEVPGESLRAAVESAA